ncbi:hypothetical protein I312_102019 [Cryptococcus bacillisporus CA1280]|uniref:uncharacterized protein n=1 Tax=Cryptococcus bacillisporus CA1280 TaxID=1296109 RepID=UPI0033682E0B
MITLTKMFHHPLISQPFLSLGLTSLALLLLVLVLLRVPGPIRRMYWFSVEGQGTTDGPLNAGVLGWCLQGTSNCTYATLSENTYLSTMINTDEALTVRIMLPLACYWIIVVMVLWVLLTVLVPFSYRIRDLDSTTRHLRFAIVEACVLCVNLFGNVLCWLAFGLGRSAYLSVQNGGSDPTSVMLWKHHTAVVALLSLLSLGTAVWGLHLRLRSAQSHWREEAVMVRCRSMALFASGAVRPEDAATLGVAGNFLEKKDSQRWSTNSSEVPSYTANSGALQHRDNGFKTGYQPDIEAGEEEEIDVKLEEGKRNSIDQIGRTSIHDSPYHAANGTVRPPT